jgi:hypothetical protein
MVLTRFQEMAEQFAAIHNASHQSCTPKMSGIEVTYLIPEWKVSQSHARSTSQSYQNIPLRLNAFEKKNVKYVGSCSYNDCC